MKITLRTLLIVLAIAALLARPRAAAGILTVDPAASRLEVAVESTLDSFTAKLNSFRARLEVGDDGAITGAEITFRFRDLKTGNDTRDRHMHEWQETERHPEVHFVLTGLEPRSGNAYDATGRLTLHGVTRDIQFPVAIRRDESRYRIDGQATLDTRDFGLPIIRRFFFLKVEPLVLVQFHVVASP